MRAQEADAAGLASGDTHDLRAIIAAQVSPSSLPHLLPHLLPLSLLQCASVPGCAGRAGRAERNWVLGKERNLTRG